MTLDTTHQASWEGIDEMDVQSLHDGYTDPDGRFWPSVRSYNDALNKMKVLQQSAWSQIYLKPVTP